MPSVGENLASAVVTYLDGLTLSQPFTPTKKLIPVYERDQLSGLDVSVHAGPVIRQRMTRGGVWQKTYTVGVVIRYAADSNAADLETKSGELQLLAEEMMEALGSATMQGLPAVEIEQDLPFDLGQVMDNGLLKTEIIIRYKGL